MSDRLLQAVRAVVRELFPNLIFAGVYEYRVDSWQNDTVSCVLAAQVNGLPPVTQVPLTPAITGGRATLERGAVVLIGFRNMDPGLPYVSHGDPNLKVQGLKIEASGAITIDGASVTINGGVFGAARMNDTVQAGPFAGVITSGSTTVKVG